MLNIYYGNMKESVYNTAAYFKYDYEDSWIVDPFVKEMIQDVDQSTVLDSGVIDSPVLGKCWENISDNRCGGYKSTRTAGERL